MVIEYAKARDPILRILPNLIGDANIVYDIGGYIGMYSLSIALALPMTRIFTFEPNPRSYQALVKNVKTLNLDKRVHLYNIGLSSKDKNIEDFYISDASARSSLYQEAAKSNHSNITKKIEIKCHSIDYLVKQTKMPIPDMVKIDTEGNELQIIKGMLCIIRKYHPKLLIETHLHNKESVIETLVKEDYSFKEYNIKGILYQNTALWFYKNE